MENCIENHGQNFLHELTELSKIDFSIEYFTTDLLRFSSTIVKSSFYVTPWVLVIINSNYFRDFFKVL